MKNLIQNSALVVVSVVVTLALCEVALRVAGYGSGNPYDRLLNHNDEYVGYRMIPGDHEAISGPAGVYEVDIVSLGLEEDRGFRDDGREDPVHSLFFGDSFVWGYGVELADIVSEQFEALTGKDAVNLGMTAFTSPTQYYRLFRQYAPELQAEYAFFGVFLGNDFGDGLNFEKWSLRGKRVSYPEWRTLQIRRFPGKFWRIRIRRFAYRESVLYRFISDRIDISGEQELPENLFEVKTGDLDLVLNSGQIETTMGRDPGRQVMLFRRALSQIVRTGVASGTQPVAFLIPTKELVYQSYFPDGPNRSIEDVRYKLMLELLEESDIEFIDLLPVFREAVANGSPQLYFRVDGHWNPAGHALAAAELLRYINARSGAEQPD